MDGNDVLVEIICDAMGQMNAFATEATERVAGEVGVFLRNVRKAAKDTVAAKNTTGEGGVKFSREMEERTQQEITKRYQQEVDQTLNLPYTNTSQ